MKTKNLTTHTGRKASAIRRLEHEAEGGALGALAGAVAGVSAGWPGLIAGALLGGAAGSLTGLGVDNEDSRRAGRTRELDEEIGVTRGEIGASNLEHPPSHR